MLLLAGSNEIREACLWSITRAMKHDIELQNRSKKVALYSPPYKTY